MSYPLSHPAPFSMLEDFYIHNPEVFKLSKRGKKGSLREFSSIKGNEEQITAKLPAIFWLIRIIIFTYFKLQFQADSQEKGRDRARIRDSQGAAKPAWPHTWTFCTVYLPQDGVPRS